MEALRTRYEKAIEDFTTEIQEGLIEPNTDSPVILDQNLLDRYRVRISGQATIMAALYQAARQNATMLEECIQRILEILKEFYLKIARAQSVAEDPIVCSLRGPIEELIYCSQMLLNRSPGYEPYDYWDNFDGIPELAWEALDTYKSFINNPKIRAALTLVSIFDVARKTDESLPESGTEEGSAVEDYDENERFIKELTARVLCTAVLVIKDLPYVARIQDDADDSIIIPIMEDILKMSKVMRDCVNEIRKYLSPLREDRILQTINGMMNAIIS